MSDPLWYRGEPYYVKMYQLTQDRGQVWLGWLGTNEVSSDYAVPIAAHPDDPVVAGAAQVQWVFDASAGDATDPASYDRLVDQRPRYLGSHGRVLEGSGKDGKYLYWVSGNPTDPAYQIVTGTPDDDDGRFTMSRVSPLDPAGSTIHADGDSYLEYRKDGDENEVLFEFVPITAYQRGSYPTWIGDFNATIGDRPLVSIVIPGSHDAGAYQISRPGGEMTSKSQNIDILSQLLAGSRFLDLRTEKYDDGVWYIRHGEDWSWVRFDHVVDQLAYFIENHPSEFVLVELLAGDTKGPDGMKGENREPWQMIFNRMHELHLNSVDELGNKTDIQKVTPNTLRAMGKNLLVFGWGDVTTWYFDVDANGHFIDYPKAGDPVPEGATRVFVAPWETKPEGEPVPGDRADLEGVYLDPTHGTPTAADILRMYGTYPMNGQIWNLQTNLPWKIYAWWTSLYDLHEYVTPGLVDYLRSGQISRYKANIINMDFLGDTVPSDVKGDPGYDLVYEVIWANRRK